MATRECAEEVSAGTWRNVINMLGPAIGRDVENCAASPPPFGGGGSFGANGRAALGGALMRRAPEIRQRQVLQHRSSTGHDAVVAAALLTLRVNKQHQFTSHSRQRVVVENHVSLLLPVVALHGDPLPSRACLCLANPGPSKITSLARPLGALNPFPLSRTPRHAACLQRFLQRF